MENTQAEVASVTVPMVQTIGHWSIKNLWQGRIGELRYFLGLFTVGIIFVLVIMGLLLIPVPSIRILFSILVYAVSLVIDISLICRRCHDLGYSGWLGLLFLVPLVNIVF